MDSKGPTAHPGSTQQGHLLGGEASVMAQAACTRVSSHIFSARHMKKELQLTFGWKMSSCRSRSRRKVSVRTSQSSIV